MKRIVLVIALAVLMTGSVGANGSVAPYPAPAILAPQQNLFVDLPPQQKSVKRAHRGGNNQEAIRRYRDVLKSSQSTEYEFKAALIELAKLHAGGDPLATRALEEILRGPIAEKIARCILEIIETYRSSSIRSSIIVTSKSSEELIAIAKLVPYFKELLDHIMYIIATDRAPGERSIVNLLQAAIINYLNNLQGQRFPLAQRDRAYRGLVPWLVAYGLGDYAHKLLRNDPEANLLDLSWVRPLIPQFQIHNLSSPPQGPFGKVKQFFIRRKTQPLSFRSDVPLTRGTDALRTGEIRFAIQCFIGVLADPQSTEYEFRTAIIELAKLHTGGDQLATRALKDILSGPQAEEIASCILEIIMIPSCPEDLIAIGHLVTSFADRLDPFFGIEPIVNRLEQGILGYLNNLRDQQKPIEQRDHAYSVLGPWLIARNQFTLVCDLLLMDPEVNVLDLSWMVPLVPRNPIDIDKARRLFDAALRLRITHPLENRILR